MFEEWKFLVVKKLWLLLFFFAFDLCGQTNIVPEGERIFLGFNVPKNDISKAAQELCMAFGMSLEDYEISPISEAEKAKKSFAASILTEDSGTLLFVEHTFSLPGHNDKEAIKELPTVGLLTSGFASILTTSLAVGLGPRLSLGFQITAGICCVASYGWLGACTYYACSKDNSASTITPFSYGQSPYKKPFNAIPPLSLVKIDDDSDNYQILPRTPSESSSDEIDLEEHYENCNDQEEMLPTLLSKIWCY